MPGEKKAEPTAPKELPKADFPSVTQDPVQYNPPGTPKEKAMQTGLRIEMLDVGFGDATLIQIDGKNILFDAGPPEASRHVRDTLNANGAEKLDVLVLSSNASEHFGGAQAVAVYHTIGEIWDNGVKYVDYAYAGLEDVTKSAKRRSVQYGDVFEFGKGKITILNPQAQRYLKSSADAIALKVEYGNFCAVLFSDSEGGGAAGNDMGTVMGGIDSKIVSGNITIACQILKVGNHGSGNAASFQLLEKMKPEIGIISVGANPGSKLPEPALIRRLGLKNVSVLRTDTMGAITITSSGNGYGIVSER